MILQNLELLGLSNSLKGSSDEIGLLKFHGTEVTKQSAELLGKSIRGFMKDLPVEIKYNSELGRIKLGNLETFGKEVRIGRDQKEAFQHIDIERLAPSTVFKDLKIKIFTNPIKL